MYMDTVCQTETRTGIPNSRSGFFNVQENAHFGNLGQRQRREQSESWQLKKRFNKELASKMQANACAAWNHNRVSLKSQLILSTAEQCFSGAIITLWLRYNELMIWTGRLLFHTLLKIHSLYTCTVTKPFPLTNHSFHASVMACLELLFVYWKSNTICNSHVSYTIVFPHSFLQIHTLNVPIGLRASSAMCQFVIVVFFHGVKPQCIILKGCQTYFAK